MSDPRLAALQAKLAANDATGALAIAGALLADAALGIPDRFATLVLRARAHEMAGRLANAIVDLDGALALDPGQSRAWNELGLLCADAGQSERAVAAFERATHLDPKYARAWNNLGNALRTVGRLPDAVRAAERAVDADATYALAWANLGALRRDIGADDAAETALRRALALDPKQRGALTTLGGLLRERSDLAAAAQVFAQAAELSPRDANLALQLAGTLAERDDLADSRRWYDEAQRRDPRLLRARFGRELTLPMIAANAQAVADARAGFAEGLARLEQGLPAAAATLGPERLQDELRWTNFLLAYQGGDDRELQARYGALVHRLAKERAPEWTRPLARRARAGARVRVGFVSTFFRDGTAGRYFEHWVTGLPRDRCEVFAYHLLPGLDRLGQRVAEGVEHFRHCPSWRPSQVAARVRADALDVLVYPELGMGAVPFALAALRLAPLQCAGWGHPVTTGQPAIDVFLSSAAMEPPDAAAHYSEELVLLPGIGTRYAMPAVPVDASRDRFGLPDAATLLLCPQSLFKVHPDNDALFARALAAVPDAKLVLFNGRDPSLTERFRARLAASGIGGDRVCWLPQCGHEDYLRINRVCDAMLDTLHWSGGNTSLDAIASGLPLVTLPGRFMRGRQSAGMLTLAGCPELIARDEAEYVAIVARLGGDRAWREGLRKRLAAGRSRIFDDPAPLAALADFLQR
ncbi:MAG: tetratricopeptide repeat protein [Burkholderiaceae bacterium]